MITLQFLVNSYGRNLHFIKLQTEGYSQADSLIQPPYNGNCVNWIVGHIACYRNRIMEMLDQPLVIDPQLADRYANGSAPVLGAEARIGQIDALKGALELSQERIAVALPTITAERAAELRSYGQFTLTVGEWLIFLLRHEAMHQGQLEILQEVIKRGKG